MCKLAHMKFTTSGDSNAEPCYLLMGFVYIDCLLRHLFAEISMLIGTLSRQCYAHLPATVSPESLHCLVF